MLNFVRAAAVILVALSFQISVIAEAEAKCTRLAFSVNDYGKIGPTEDAKKLLDKYIGEWTAERGISGYKTGPKSVTCKLFLDFIVFDEYTCRAEASVCWDEGPKEPVLRPAQATEPADAAAPAQTAQTNAPAQPRKAQPAKPATQGGYNSVFEAN